MLKTSVFNTPIKVTSESPVRFFSYQKFDIRNLNTALFLIITVNNRQFISLYIIGCTSFISIPLICKSFFVFCAFSDNFSYLFVFFDESFFTLVISFILYWILSNSFLFLFISDSKSVCLAALLMSLFFQFFSFSSKLFSIKLIWFSISFSISKFSSLFKIKLYLSSCFEAVLSLFFDINDLSLIKSIKGDESKFKA